MPIDPTTGRVCSDGKSVTRRRQVELLQLERSSHADVKQHAKYRQFLILTEVGMPQYQGKYTEVFFSD